jgi:hypothetical protein
MFGQQLAVNVEQLTPEAQLGVPQRCALIGDAHRHDIIAVEAKQRTSPAIRGRFGLLIGTRTSLPPRFEPVGATRISVQSVSMPQVPTLEGWTAA